MIDVPSLPQPDPRLSHKYDPLHWGWAVLAVFLIFLGVIIDLLLHQQQQSQQLGSIIRASNLTQEQREEHIKMLEQQQPSITNKLLAALALEIGIALVVAYFVAKTVEKAAADRAAIEHEQRIQKMTTLHNQWVEEIRDDVFQSMLGTVIPEELLLEVREGILKARFVRNNMQLKYYFQPLLTQAGAPDSGEKMLLMRATVSYDLVNIGKQQKDHVIHHYFEDLLRIPACPGRFIRFEITDLETGTSLINLTPEQLKDQRPVPGSEYHTANGGVKYRLTEQGLRVTVHLVLGFGLSSGRCRS